MANRNDIFCETPGLRLRSGGRGRGLARGRGLGPIGWPKSSPWGRGLGQGGGAGWNPAGWRRGGRFRNLGW